MKYMLNFIITWMILSVGFLTVESGEALAIAPKGNRVLGIDVNEANDGAYDKAVQAAINAGMEAASISLNWDTLEPNARNYDKTLLDIANQFYPAYKVKLDIFIRPVDTDGKHVPSDLKNVRFSDPRMIERFKQLMDFIFSKISKVDINLLAIGNELDLAYGPGDSFWNDYETFYREVKKYIKQKRPDIKVGVVGTLEGLLHKAKNDLKRLNQISDIVIATYYPIKGDFTVRAPFIVQSDFDAIVNLYRNKTIYFSEAGYPSSPMLGSSEQKQSEFIRQIFSAWDRHQSHIPYISITWLHDLSDHALKDLFSYYGSSDKNFGAYLGTLGLKNHDGSNKLAYDTLVAEAKARGWKTGPVPSGSSASSTTTTTSTSSDAGEEKDVLELATKNAIDSFFATLLGDSSEKQSSPITPSSPAPSSPSPLSTAGLVATPVHAIPIGFSRKQGLFTCDPKSRVTLDSSGPRAGGSSMLWSYRYSHEWQWCTKQIRKSRLSGASEISFWLRSEQPGSIFFQVGESGGETFFSIVKTGPYWEEVDLQVNQLQPDPEKLQDGFLDMSRISQILIADNAGAEGNATGSQNVWLAELVFK